MSGEEELEFLGTWDYLIAFKEFILYRLSDTGVKRFRDAHEIPTEIDLYDWMENRFGGMIESYANHRGVQFDDAREILMARPYIDISARWKKFFKR